jgi:hypothetical protein
MTKQELGHILGDSFKKTTSCPTALQPFYATPFTARRRVWLQKKLDRERKELNTNAELNQCDQIGRNFDTWQNNFTNIGPYVKYLHMAYIFVHFLSDLQNFLKNNEFISQAGRIFNLFWSFFTKKNFLVTLSGRASLFGSSCRFMRSSQHFQV